MGGKARGGNAGKVVLTALGVVVLGTVFGWWFLEWRVGDEKLIEELVARAEHGVETKSVEEIMSCLSRDYEGQGSMSREEIWRLAMQWRRSPTQAEVAIEDYRVTLKGAEATGQFQVQVVLEEEGPPRAPISMLLRVGFERRLRGLRKVWLVKSVGGFDPDMFLEEAL